MPFRAFVAIPVPPDASLSALVEELRALGVKTTDPEHLHLTLSFLGDVPDDAAPRLAAALDEAAAEVPAFTFELHGVGAFPNERKPRVLWAGIRHEPKLDELARRVRALLPPDDVKPFRAHLTLGRANEDAQLSSWLRQRAQAVLPDVHVGDARLYRSTLSKWGAKHEAIHVASLGA